MDCGIEDFRVLDIDHTESVWKSNIKRTSKKGMLQSGEALWKALAKAGFPEGYKVRCRNCNWIRYIEEVGSYESVCGLDVIPTSNRNPSLQGIYRIVKNGKYLNQNAYAPGDDPASNGTERGDSPYPVQQTAPDAN